MNTDLYIIEYKLHGEAKSFIIRTKIRSNADEGHFVRKNFKGSSWSICHPTKSSPL
jgi:hypothetical protein